MRGDDHPNWGDVVRRGQGRTMVLLVAANGDTYRAGYRAGVDAVSAAVAEAIDSTTP